MAELETLTKMGKKKRQSTSPSKQLNQGNAASNNTPVDNENTAVSSEQGNPVDNSSVVNQTTTDNSTDINEIPADNNSTHINETATDNSASIDQTPDSAKINQAQELEDSTDMNQYQHSADIIQIPIDTSSEINQVQEFEDSGGGRAPRTASLGMELEAIALDNVTRQEAQESSSGSGKHTNLSSFASKKMAAALREPESPVDERPQRKVLIIGGGVAGLVLALCLKRVGGNMDMNIVPIVYEKNKDFSSHQESYMIWKYAVDVLVFLSSYECMPAD